MHPDHALSRVMASTPEPDLHDVLTQFLIDVATEHGKQSRDDTVAEFTATQLVHHFDVAPKPTVTVTVRLEEVRDIFLPEYAERILSGTTSSASEGDAEAST